MTINPALNPVALVTGASGNLGHAIASALCASGCMTACHYFSNKPALQENETSRLFQADFSDPVQVHSLVDRVHEHFGRLDILVNNAAVRGPSAGIGDLSFADWRKVFAVNCDASFILCSKAMKLMSRGGRVINILTVAMKSHPMGSSYGASKAAVASLTRTMAAEGAASGIIVNAVSPGPLETDRSNMSPEDRVHHERIQEKLFIDIPAGRKGRPEEVACLVRWLCLESPDYLTGQIISIDGGFRLG